MIIGFTPTTVADYLAQVPGMWRERISGMYAGKRTAAAALKIYGADRFDAEHSADGWLSDVVGRMRKIRVPLNMSDSDLCTMARQCAAAAIDLAKGPGFADAAELRRRMADYVQGYGIEPPPWKIDEETGELVGVQGAIKRMADHQWWRRRLRAVQGRAIESEAIRLGYVGKREEVARQEIYASTLTTERRAQQKARNKKALENTTVTNQHGDEYTLAELAEKAVSNPVIRRGELMTRISGFEAVARGLGHIALFFTVTCPSRMHARKTAGKGSVENTGHDGTTPRQAQQYLSGMWAKARAAMARAKAGIYGFRIAEPHHDGCPHWHLLLFVAAECKDDVCRIFARYARSEDAGELSSKEASKARFMVKVIDDDEGTAAGYVAKYVSKNIDGGGYQVQGDLEGVERSAFTPSHRVEAWAACWGIRQFQQIGGPPVGVWRELRRLKASEEHGATLSSARAAADEGNWSSYVDAMQGPLAKRKDRPLAVAYTRPGERYDAEKGEAYPAPETRYGEEAPRAVYGVADLGAGSAFVTRVYQWEVRCGGSEDKCSVESGLNRGIGFGGFLGRGRGVSLPVDVLAFDLPWTRVNNCTEASNEHRNTSARNEKGIIESPFWARDVPFAGDGKGCADENGRPDRRALH